LASLQQRRPARTRAPRPGITDAAAQRIAAAVARDLQAPWPELMRSMEASRSSDISLLQLEPVVARDTVRITADARHAEAMFEYLEQLRVQGLSEVTLMTHQLQTQEPGTPIRFQAQARWTSLETRTGGIGAAVPVTGPSISPGSDLRALQTFIEQERGAP
ncbi:MAG TPA: hypothetical protein PLE54_16960, partial [Burkholderiaceae bacterium]|nr:hypothetical protein [Burkholderiaceae bacterium]